MSYLTKVSWRIRANTHLYGGDCRAWNRRSNTARLYSKKPAMEKKEEAFYVVRRGDAIGFYTSLDQCQPQQLTSSSICDSPVSVFKGQGLQSKARDYLASRGLQNALYTISASDFKEDLFGTLVPCPLQDSSRKRSVESVEQLASSSQKQSKLTRPDCRSCVLKFDGASKGNPGNSGAGAVLLADDGTLICKLSEGCGKITNNMAEYRALRLGLKSALEKGFNRISVHGDSKLVCMQVQGLWKAKHENLISLHKEVMELKNKFISFQIVHVLRDRNSAADAAANKGVGLCDGEIVEETP